MRARSLDHLVLTVADVETTVNFYARVLGMEPETFDGGRRALRFGEQKLNLHRVGAEIEPYARSPTPGSADLCFVVDSLAGVVDELAGLGVSNEEGPVARAGARGPMRSVYFRDPDGNLVEASEYH